MTSCGCDTFPSSQRRGGAAAARLARRGGQFGLNISPVRPPRLRLRFARRIHPSSARRGIRLFLALLALSASTAYAQTPPDISGYWELRYDSFNIPAASLTAPAAADQPNQRQRDLEAIRWCINVGVPALMGDRAPLDIRQSPTVTAVVAKSPSSVRYIYTDGHNHPDKDDFDPTTNGHSIGHWEVTRW